MIIQVKYPNPSGERSAHLRQLDQPDEMVVQVKVVQVRQLVIQVRKLPT